MRDLRGSECDALVRLHNDLFLRNRLKMTMSTNKRYVRSSVGKICKIYYSNKYKSSNF